MLRDMLGEETLKKALENYRSQQDTEPRYCSICLKAVQAGSAMVF